PFLRICVDLHSGHCIQIHLNSSLHYATPPGHSQAMTSAALQISRSASSDSSDKSTVSRKLDIVSADIFGDYAFFQ
ncbi:MAG: hypothetical protein LH647_21625, partial [Leptolyngbyaceae cyanobacterium CAN_BIN12]|nr:hypothetical protein [Leptolyngbyaceae cyanobacterium CAN_BIN12]